MNKNELIVFLLHLFNFSNDISRLDDPTPDHACVDSAQVELFAFARVDELHRVCAEAGGEFFAACMWIC